MSGSYKICIDVILIQLHTNTLSLDVMIRSCIEMLSIPISLIIVMLVLSIMVMMISKFTVTRSKVVNHSSEHQGEI